MKFSLVLLVFCVFPFDAISFEIKEGSSGRCSPIMNHLRKYTGSNGKIALNRIDGETVKIRVGGLKNGNTTDLDASQISIFRRVWLRYEDIDGDNKKELFAPWVSYANTYTDNRSSIFIFDYPNHDHLADIFLKGKYKSKFYSELESWLINNYEWDFYAGPGGAKNLLPSTLELSKNVVWRSGKGFSSPPNDYFLNVFSAGGSRYVLVSGRHEKQGDAFVVEVTSVEKQTYSSLCRFSL